MPTEPIRQGTKLIWVFDGDITVWLDRWKEQRDGLSAECSVRLGSGTLRHGRLNLAALPTQAQWVKILNEAHPREDWAHLLQTVCLQGLNAQRRGEPVEVLTDCDDILHVPWRLNPLIHEGVPTVIFGPGGIGKSYLAMYLALLVESGEAGCGYLPVRSRVLILDWEMESRYARQRAMLIRRGHPELAGAIPLYQRCEQPLPELVPDVAATIAKEGVGLLIIDSLAPAAGQDQNASQTAVGFFRALRQLRVSALVLAHVAKNSEQKSIYGSVFYSNLARSVYQAEGGPNGCVVLHHEKHNFSAKQPSRALALQFSEEAVQFTPTELPAVADEKIGDKLAAIMAEGAFTSGELATHSGLDRQTVYNALSAGKADKRWAKRRDDTWRLLEPI